MTISCIYCRKECKISDSRPYPNSKSKERIHNRCQLKKSLTEKAQTSQSTVSHAVESSIIDISAEAKSDIKIITDTIATRVAKEDLDVEKLFHERKISRLVENRLKKSEEIQAEPPRLFFDLKAGIAKPHEKRQYLHHRNLSEIALRYDDHGFQEEAVGRAYDSTGKDLNTLGDGSDGDSNDEPDQVKQPLKVDPGRIPSNSKSNSEKRKISTKYSEKSQKLKVDDKNPCWFCLSSPEVEKHLILAIGEFCYLTLAKGGLLDEHFLILPIEHINSLNDSDGNSKELLAELSSFKKSLVDYFSHQSKGVVFFERNFRSVHWQLQVVPIPNDLLDTVETNIKLVSKKQFKNISYLDIPPGCSLSDMVPQGAPYIFWQIEPSSVQFVSQIQVKGSFFPVQLGRSVLADLSILNCPEMVNWTECKKSKEEYIRLVSMIKEKYNGFDIT